MAPKATAQTWTQMGPSVAQDAILPKVACDAQGRVWVTMQDLATPSHHGSVKRFVPALGALPAQWEYVGAAGSTSISNDWWPSLAFSRSGEIFRASYDYRVGAPQFAAPLLNMRQWNPVTGQWELMQPFPVSLGEAHMPAMKLDDWDRPVVAYRHGNPATVQAPFGAVSVLRYERLPGGGWAPRFLGGQGFSADLFPAAAYPKSISWFNCLDVDSGGRLWAAWQESNAIMGGVPVVATYREVDDRWEMVGDFRPLIPPGRSGNLELAVDKYGTPYLAAYLFDQFRVYRWVGDLKTGAWQMLGIPVGFLDAPKMTPGSEYRDWVAFALDPDGAPYLAYRAQNRSNRVIVRRFLGGVWQLVGNPAFTGPVGEDDQLSLAFSGSTPVLALRHSLPTSLASTSREVQVWYYR
ncbi:MAG: hypothetical protein H6830_07145 [Planctomycetes bacterium]|nr:hypothetical protein [Planctomycetota bacterium]MCB9911296.1 hypothetical protein [Planctomycetota bacterium]MCB9911448.1 hypothetical protein [Planctomycetota bacterium]HRV81182.1 hypothetical protein [Planctomycetota bacterium]